jgi:hypothetical protein
VWGHHHFALLIAQFNAYRKIGIAPKTSHTTQHYQQSRHSKVGL